MNSNLQKKLFRFEETPPDTAWEKIAEELDNETSFSDRLYNYEETPPLTVWATVNASLNEEPAKVVSFFSQYKKPLRYVSAASVVAALLAVLTLTNHQVQVRVPETANRISPAPSSTKPYQESKPLPSQTTDEDEASVAVNNYQSPRSERESAKRTMALVRLQSILPAFSLRKTFIPKEVEQKPLVDQSAENFMVFSDGEGNVMRLPKKLFSLVCCKDGDGSCKVRLEHLRRTLSANVAPIGFGGMIDMLRQLQ